MKSYHELVNSIDEMKMTLRKIIRKEKLTFLRAAERICISPVTLKRFLESDQVYPHPRTLGMIDDFLMRYEQENNKGI
jgi:hypothetical protein